MKIKIIAERQHIRSRHSGVYKDIFPLPEMERWSPC